MTYKFKVGDRGVLRDGQLYHVLSVSSLHKDQPLVVETDGGTDYWFLRNYCADGSCYPSDHMKDTPWDLLPPGQAPEYKRITLPEVHLIFTRDGIFARVATDKADMEKAREEGWLTSTCYAEQKSVHLKTGAVFDIRDLETRDKMRPLSAAP